MKPAERQDWHRKSAPEALAELETSASEGLARREIESRRSLFGPNALETARKTSLWKILLKQFADLLVLVLLAAALIAVFLGEPRDSVVILAIVLLNGILGFVQEYRAERAMEALQGLAMPHATVRRHGRVAVIPAYELVPGDVVLLEAGNLVPADLRLIESAKLEINESALTGESNPVDKGSGPILLERLPIADQRNMAFKGTLVSGGRGVGVAVRTGMRTELGKIARLLREEVEVETPLQRRLARFAKNLAVLVIGLCIVIFLIGLARGEPPLLMFLTSLSLAVAAIPEALPAVVSVSLALGARTMSRRNALVRKLTAVEALGSVTFICSDKTGTLTENRMTVQDIRAQGIAAEEPLYRALALSNDAFAGADGTLQGDPTETALLRAAMDRGYFKERLEMEHPRIAEVPFTSASGMMTTVHREGEARWVFCKGAPERVFPRCTRQLSGAGTESFEKGRAEAAVREMASRGQRVLAFGFKRDRHEGSAVDLEEAGRELVFLGLVGLVDPLREGARKSIEVCVSAGIRPVMITGDHPETAAAIARKLSLLTGDRSGIMTGATLSELSDEELRGRIGEISVYARVAPEQKIRIVKALQADGQVVAMTGDGVNDAPALRRSDIGVAMGKGGTDVAREAAHLILLDDNFATIVTAVGEGRRIYDNIRKFVRFSLSGNSGELWALFLAPLVGLPTPLLPIQILWINLVTDGLPGLALAFEPAEADHMRRPPRRPNESIFSRGLWQHSVWVGLLTGGMTLGILAGAYGAGDPHWQSMAFTVLALIQMGHVLAIRSEKDSLFAIGLFSNPYALGAVAITIVLQMMCLYVPAFNSLLKTTPLTRGELAVCLAGSSVVFVAVEIEKWLRRRR